MNETMVGFIVGAVCSLIGVIVGYVISFAARQPH